MAFQTYISVDWSVSPRIVTIASPETEVTVKDLYDTLRVLETYTNAMDEPTIVSAGGLEELGGGTSVGLTVTLLDALLAFEDRIGPTYVQCNVSGGNLVAIDGVGTYFTTPIEPTTFTQVVVTASSSATSQNQASIEYASFEGGVWVDQSNGGVNDNEPLAGNAQFPVSTILLANTVINQRGLPRKMYILGNAILDIGDSIEYTTLVGENANRTSITINEAADTIGCEIQEATVSGNLDGNSILRNCVIDSLNYINGKIFQCMLASTTISLGGSSPAYFINCMSAEGHTNMPVIDMNGPTNNGSTPLIMHNYSGYIHVKEKTGPYECTVNLASGTVILDTTCINGSFTVTGDGKVNDENGNHLSTGIINGGLEFYNEANFGEHLHDIWKVLGLDPNQPITIGNGKYLSVDLDVDVTDNGNGTYTLSRN